MAFVEGKSQSLLDWCYDSKEMGIIWSMNLRIEYDSNTLNC